MHIISESVLMLLTEKYQNLPMFAKLGAFFETQCISILRLSRTQ